MKQRLSRLGLLSALFGSFVLSGLLLSQSGCASPRGLRPQLGSTPTLSRQERYARISRNWGLEFQMLSDDIDSLLLLRPETGLTQWNVP